ncbi:MAG: Hsp20/alpha crystallin family protein [Planctomycetota bacterium]|nr:Hsp20/alpha crystallin family protein [Planctomycetota bacterium]
MATKKNDATAKTQAFAGLGLGGILDGIGKLIETAAKLKDSGGISQAGEFNVPGLGKDGKGIFGFSIRTMAGGEGQEVTVKPFGNIHKTKEGLAVEEDREPVVDVLEEGQQIRVIVELPGVSEAEIAHETRGDILTITTKGHRQYHAEVLLPARVDPARVTSKYNNGVLELTFTKVTSR